MPVKLAKVYNHKFFLNKGCKKQGGLARNYDRVIHQSVREKERQKNPCRYDSVKKNVAPSFHKHCGAELTRPAADVLDTNGSQCVQVAAFKKRATRYQIWTC